jgi:hypothetical protein
MAMAWRAADLILDGRHQRTRVDSLRSHAA